MFLSDFTLYLGLFIQTQPECIVQQWRVLYAARPAGCLAKLYENILYSTFVSAKILRPTFTFFPKQRYNTDIKSFQAILRTEEHATCDLELCDHLSVHSNPFSELDSDSLLCCLLSGLMSDTSVWKMFRS